MTTIETDSAINEITCAEWNYVKSGGTRCSHMQRAVNKILTRSTTEPSAMRPEASPRVSCENRRIRTLDTRFVPATTDRGANFPYIICHLSVSI